MLQSLRIENYAIIDEINIEFDKGLNIITGETGAGKSILLGALGLIMGQRADSKVLFNKERKCIVEACYNNYTPSVNQLLEDHDYDVEKQLIIRREINLSGKSRAFVNDTPAKLNFLQKVNEELIDLNQQSEISLIRDPHYQLKIIDALAGNEKVIKNYQQKFSDYRGKNKQLFELQQNESVQLKEMDFMRFQLDELNEVDLIPDEQNKLETESELLSKADDIRLIMEETAFKLRDNDGNIIDQLNELSRKWFNYLEVHPEIKKGGEQLTEVIESIQDLIYNADKIVSELDFDPAKLSEINERLDVIFRLQKKHGVNDIDSLIEIKSDLENKLSTFINRGETIENLKKEITDLEVALRKMAGELSTKRKKVIPSVVKMVNSMLDELAMESAEIKIQLEVNEELKSDGLDKVSFLFKSNKGAEFLPIKKVASGGEGSRLMLSIKSVVAERMQLPTMIFDEIDTGVSGEVAGKMGNILKKLSSQHQLITITHSPQVASRANNHFFVYKTESKERTFTKVKLLEKDDRINELAKMLSGDPPSTFALDNAKDLIKKQSITN